MNSYLTPYEIETKCASLPLELEEDMAKTNQTPEEVQDKAALIEALEAQVKKLEAELKFVKDKNIALNTLLDIGEEQGIKLRKKAGVKQ